MINPLAQIGSVVPQVVSELKQ